VLVSLYPSLAWI